MTLLKLTSKLTSQQKMILDSTKKFANDFLKKRVYNDFKNQIIDKTIFKEFGNLGILGPTIPDYNCIGESYLTYGLIAKEIEKIDSGYRSMFSVQSSLVMNPIYKWGTDLLKEQYLPKLASGDYIGCFGLTEPNAGSNPNSMTTTAIKKNNSYLLNGSKTWISNSPIADVFIIWAKLENQISGFIVDRNMNGIHTPVIKNKLSLQTSVTGEILLNDVKIPLENKLNCNGLTAPLQCLNDARLGISFGVLGASENCLETTIEYVNTRKQFETFLSEKQITQIKLANMFSNYNLALLSCHHMAKLIDNDELDLNEKSVLISMNKRNSCEKALDIARMCRNMLGANGITEEMDIFRHMINLETVYTYEGTHDIHSLILGKYITGYSAF